jgi:hypothetical protein
MSHRARTSSTASGSGAPNRSRSVPMSRSLASFSCTAADTYAETLPSLSRSARSSTASNTPGGKLMALFEDRPVIPKRVVWYYRPRPVTRSDRAHRLARVQGDRAVHDGLLLATVTPRGPGQPPDRPGGEPGADRALPAQAPRAHRCRVSRGQAAHDRRSKRAPWSRSILQGVTHWTPTALQASGILIRVLLCGAGSS